MSVQLNNNSHIPHLSKMKNQLNDELQMLLKKTNKLNGENTNMSALLDNKQQQIEKIKKKCEVIDMQIKEIKINQLKIGTSIELEQEKHSAILLELNNHSKVFDDTLQGFREQKGAIKVDNQNVDQNSKLNDNVRNIYNRKLLSLKTMLANQQQRHSDLVTADTKRKQMLMIRKNKNAARIIRLRKQLQAEETKRATANTKIEELQKKLNE